MRPEGFWTCPKPWAKLSPNQKTQSGEVAMTMLRLVAFIFAAAFTASAAQAEIKTEWVEYSHGDVKLKGYLAYDDAVTGKRPAVLVIHAREGMTANTIKNVEM